MKYTYFCLILVCWFLLNLCIAQASREAIDYYGNTVHYEVSTELSFSNNTEAVAVINNIMSFTGLKQNFKIKANPDVYIALATVEDNERTIFYDPTSIKELVADSGGSNWISITILAHEIAHHLNGHLLILETIGSGNRKKLELEADEFAGFILYKMEAKLEEAQLALQSLPDTDIPSNTHPNKAARLAAVAKGWYDAQTESSIGPRIESSITSTLTVNSQPSGALVYLDNESLGVTPLEDVEVAIGEHSLRLVKDGYNDEVETFSVKLGQDLRYNYTLSTILPAAPTTPTLTTGTLSISSTPNEAMVYIDDKYVGDTPLQNHILEEGKYSLTLKKAGYKDLNGDFRVGLGQNVERKFTLTIVSNMGKLTITSTPEGARVEINGQYVGQTPLNDYELDINNYDVELRLEGYEVYKRKLEISSATDNKAINVTLEALSTKGKVNLGSIPSGARVYVDERYVGMTPLENYFLEVGSYQLRINLEGYEDLTANLTVEKGKTTEATLKLIRVAGTQPISHNADWAPVKRDFNGTTMVLVPAGSFTMGSTESQIDTACNEIGCPRSFLEDEIPRSKQGFVKPFWIDKTEVTRGAYDSCVSAGVCTRTQSSRFSTTANQPITQVTWYQAATYCKWRGARLPTEVEWEYAARGPDGLIYPWGNTTFGNEANHCDSNCANSSWFKDVGLTYKHSNHNDGFAETAPVGSYPNGASWVGALDMSGNVWEWTSSLYRGYPYVVNDGRALTGNETSVSAKVTLRSGSFALPTFDFRTANRGGNDASSHSNYDGFRCASQ